MTVNSLSADPRSADHMSTARRAMIDSQLRTSGVNETFVLARMGAVAREEFVPETARSFAYMDRAVPLGGGRYLAAPLVHGKMLAEAQPTMADRALVVEAGSGYLAELLRPLVGELDTIGLDEAAGATRKRKTYSLLLVDGAVEELPDSLVKRLDDGGRVVTGLVVRGVSRLASGRKIGKDVALQSLAELGVPVLPEFAKAKAWSF